MADSIQIPRIAKGVARKLGFYVYLYVNPIDGKVFYVGKGKNGRALAHLRVQERKAITREIRRIRSAGSEPQIEILAHGLGTPEMALKVEAAAIDLLGIANLTNLVRGHGTAFGRLPLHEVVAHYTKRKADIREPAVLIRINKLYRYGMTDVELYDATRSAWKLGPRRNRAQFAFAVYEGVVREVYRITGCFRRGRLSMCAAADALGVGQAASSSLVHSRSQMFVVDTSIVLSAISLQKGLRIQSRT